ncbi:MAG: ABC transporter ATP-binding protein [Pseudomonadota bacterium]
MKLPKSALAFIFYFARKQWLKFSIIIFSFIVWAVSDAIFPYFLKKIVNTLQNYQGERSGIYVAIGSTLLLLIVFWFAAEFFMRVQGITQIYTFPRFRANIREAVFKYATSHSHEYFSSNFAGNLAKKLADLSTSCQTILEIICFNGITALTGTIIVLVMMWQTSPVFAAILAAWICLHFCIIFLFFQRGNKLSAIHSEAVSALSGKIVDVFSNMLNARLFARSRFEAEYLKKFQDDEINKAKAATWVVEKMRICLGFNGLAMMFGMIYGLLYGWVHHWVTLGDFTQVLMQAFWLLGWMWYISFQMTMFSRELGTVSNALALVNQAHDLVDKPDAPSLVIQNGNITFNAVAFAYNKNGNVFKNLNVKIPAGEKIGLVGFSGSGKTTFVNLILRFYDIQSGSITIDDQNIANVTQDSLRSQIAMIPQDPALFHRTLMENIRYGRLDATDEEVIQASKLAHCDEFIEKLDDQYEALVGERGIKLSGGQRQRIAIARAMLKNAPILILDEATSALDSVTEKLIQQSLHALMQGKTTIVIAHRLSTLADMDRILVFDKGEIIEEGTKDSLLKTGGHFAKLWAMQTDGFLPES